MPDGCNSPESGNSHCHMMGSSRSLLEGFCQVDRHLLELRLLERQRQVDRHRKFPEAGRSSLHCTLSSWGSSHCCIRCTAMSLVAAPSCHSLCAWHRLLQMD